MLKSELIKENKNLLIQNGQLMYLLEFGELRFEDSNHQIIWKRDSNARILQERIDNAIEYMKPRFMNCIDNNKRYFEDNDIQQIYEILKGEKE